jgi:cell volume regulation protein A
MFIARPAAVFACLIRSEFDLKDKIFISWAGFKGAVPIILATYPMMEGMANSQFLFNLIFFLVIISVLFQGKTLSYMARILGLYRNPT